MEFADGEKARIYCQTCLMQTKEVCYLEFSRMLRDQPDSRGLVSSPLAMIDRLSTMSFRTSVDLWPGCYISIARIDITQYMALVLTIWST